MSTSLIGLSVTAKKGDYIREKFGSVGVVYPSSPAKVSSYQPFDKIANRNPFDKM